MSMLLSFIKPDLSLMGHNCKEMLLLRPMMVESLTNDQQKIRLTPNQTKKISVISLLLLLDSETCLYLVIVK